MLATHKQSTFATTYLHFVFCVSRTVSASTARFLETSLPCPVSLDSHDLTPTPAQFNALAVCGRRHIFVLRVRFCNAGIIICSPTVAVEISGDDHVVRPRSLFTHRLTYSKYDWRVEACRINDKQSHWPTISFSCAAVATDLLIKTVDSSFRWVIIEYSVGLAGISGLEAAILDLPHPVWSNGLDQG